jgi:tetratricopeptide (TPR) repeat protein
MHGEQEANRMTNQIIRVSTGNLIVSAMMIGFCSTTAFAELPSSGEESGPAQEEPVADGETEVSEAREAAIPVFNEGVAALEAEDMPTALEYFSTAAKIDPDFPEAHVATAAVAMELKNFQIAADAAEEILRLQPDNMDAVGTAYFAELMIGDIDRLIPSARRLADASPELVSNEMLQHAQVLFDDNELAGSRALLEVILEREPELAPAYFQLGLTCNMLGDVECAKEALRKFLEVAPDDPDAETAQSLLDYL